MTPRTRSLLLQAGSFGLGGVLLWLALRSVDFGALGEVLRTANYGYLVPLAFVAMGAHALRAWRWQMLLEALPEARPIPFRQAFSSVMIGYMVNYAAPRLGEVARAANLASLTRLSFSGIFGTVVVERILDVLTLGVATLLALVLMAEQMAGLAPLFAPVADFVREAPVAWGLIVVLGLGVAGGLLALLVLLLRRSARFEGIAGRVGATLASFRGGLASVLRARLMHAFETLGVRTPA